MTYTELLLDIGWYEWILYIPVVFFLFLMFFHKDLDYVFKVNEEYKSPFFSSLFYAMCIPDKFLQTKYTNLDEVRKLELMINGLDTKKVLLTRDERKCILTENGTKNNKKITFMISDQHDVLLDGTSILLPPKLLIQVVHLWKESKKDIPSKGKKTLLT